MNEKETKEMLTLLSDIDDQMNLSNSYAEHNMSTLIAIDKRSSKIFELLLTWHKYYNKLDNDLTLFLHTFPDTITNISANTSKKVKDIASEINDIQYHTDNDDKYTVADLWDAIDRSRDDLSSIIDRLADLGDDNNDIYQSIRNGLQRIDDDLDNKL